jgi:hypothetical protein
MDAPCALLIALLTTYSNGDRKPHTARIVDPHSGPIGDGTLTTARTDGQWSTRNNAKGVADPMATEPAKVTPLVSATRREGAFRGMCDPIVQPTWKGESASDRQAQRATAAQYSDDDGAAFMALCEATAALKGRRGKGRPSVAKQAARIVAERAERDGLDVESAVGVVLADALAGARF